MTNEILKHPATYAILGITLSLAYIAYIQVVLNVMYIKHIIINKYNKLKDQSAETIDPITGNIIKVNSQNTKFNTMKYDLATSLGFNFLLISILALVYIECSL